MTLQEIQLIPVEVEQSYFDLRAYACALRALEVYRDGLCGKSSEYSQDASDLAHSFLSRFLQQAIDALGVHLSNYHRYYGYGKIQRDLKTANCTIRRLPGRGLSSAACADPRHRHY